MAKEQNYQFADCFIHWEDERETEYQRVRIALRSRQDLGYVPGSVEDKGIFLYCDGYESFLKFLAYSKNTEGYSIIKIFQLY